MNQRCVLLVVLWLLGAGAAAGHAIQGVYVNSEGPFTCSAETLDEVGDFCLFRALRRKDCDALKQVWLDQQQEGPGGLKERCSIYLVLMNPEILFENISWRWLVTLLPDSACEIIVVEHTIRPEEVFVGNYSGSTFLPAETSPGTIIMLMTTLHEFGVVNVEAERAHALGGIAWRLETVLRSRGGGKVVLVVANDEFKMFPLSFYREFDTVFRLGDFDPRPCMSAQSGCRTTHWIPRGPSKKAFEVLSNTIPTASFNSTNLLRPASERRYLANFIGNVDCALCATMTKAKYEKTVKKSCYRTPLRGAVLQGLYNALPEFQKELFLRPLSGYGLDSTHGAKEGLSQEDFLATLSNSAFTLCVPGASPESTRIYEALEAGSIPILQKPTMEGGLLFGPGCPLPFVDSQSPGAWQKEIVTFLLHWQKQPNAALDSLQGKVMDWWKRYKDSLRARVKAILLAPKNGIHRDMLENNEVQRFHETNRQLVSLHGMVESKELGAITQAKILIHKFMQLCQYELSNRITLQGEFNANSCPWLLSAGAYAAHIVNLRQEFFCLANASLWYDPFSPTLHDMIAATHWKHEEFPEREMANKFAELLHRVNNHSKAWQRYPLLPKKMLEVRRGGAAAKALMVALRLCMKYDSQYDYRSSMWYHGLLHNKEIKEMLERHLSHSPPPLYDQV
jgi:hypothetical protein